MITFLKKNFTVLDFLVIFIVVSSLIVALLWFTRSKEYVYVDLGTEYGQIVPPYYWYANEIKEGDLGYNEFGTQVAEVVQVDNVDYGGDRRFLRVQLKLEAIKDKRTDLYRYNNQRLRIGDELSITIGKVNLSAQIVNLQTQEELNQQLSYFGEGKYLKLRIYAEDVYRWSAEKFSDDFEIKNTSGETILTIEEVVRITPSKPELIAENDRLTIQNSEILRDVELIVRVKVHCANDVCFYNKNYPVRLGSGIWAHNPENTLPYSIIMEIIDESSQPN